MNTITIKEVARIAGVSVSTVSRVINDMPDVNQQTKLKVRKIIEEHGYVPNATAKTLKQMTTNIIGLVVKGISNPFFVPIVERIQQEINKTKYIPLVHYIDESDDEVLAASSLVAEKKALGIVFLGGNPQAKMKTVTRLKVPCVLATLSIKAPEHKNISCVGVNDAEAAGKAVDYLIENGHRRIAVLGGRRLAHDLIWDRYEGIRQSFESHGLEFSDDLYIESMFSLKDAYNAMSRTLANKNTSFTALFAMSDLMAIGAMRAIFDHGLTVPDDISVIGFDGIEIAAYYNPPLTTVRQPFEEIARRSAELIIQNVQGENLEQTIELSTEIIVGASVRKLF